ncbi:MAG: nucleotide exchange factor GrpE [Caldilineaceae bacterium]|nr:nucleotide exchange factor GrpE [Caldilineaceae bacterium]
MPIADTVTDWDDRLTEPNHRADEPIPYADDDPRDGEFQSQGHLYYLMSQNEMLQAQVAQLLAEAQEQSTQVAALTRHFTGGAASDARHAERTELVTRLETLQEQLDELNKTVTKLSRSQFKSNTLTESREQQVNDSLSTLQEIATRRDEIAADREMAQQRRLAQLRSDARGALAADLLPGLDGLELALEHGPQILAEQRRREEAVRAEQTRRQQTPPPSVWSNLRRVFGEAERETTPPALPAVVGETSEALGGWLQGLELVRERFLALLAKESIQPIDALGRPFDPRLHVAVGGEDRRDVAANTVVAVLRKGYVQGERVLRYAEVLVSRAPKTATDGHG